MSDETAHRAGTQSDEPSSEVEPSEAAVFRAEMFSSTESWMHHRENEREAAEQERLVAEQDRDSAENQRLVHEEGRESAEVGRQDAEDLRVAAEDLRVAAEEARVAAETLRESTDSAKLLQIELQRTATLLLEELSRVRKEISETR